MRTNLPFGHVISAFVFLFALVVACWWLVRSMKSKATKRIQLASSLFFIGFLLVIAWSNIRDDDVDWNLLIRGNETLVGSWKNDNGQLLLRSNGDCSCTGLECQAVGASGKWRRFGDFEIEFVPTFGSPVKWRITDNHGVYQLVSGAKGGSDSAYILNFSIVSVVDP